MRHVKTCALGVLIVAAAGLILAADQKITLVLGGKMCDLYRPSVETALKKVPGVTTDASVKPGNLEDAVNGVKGGGWHCKAEAKR